MVQYEGSGILGSSVRRGVKLLDRIEPLWFEAIEGSTLDMSSSEWDVVARVYKDKYKLAPYNATFRYRDALHLLGLGEAPWDLVRHFGFSVGGLGEDRWASLNYEWFRWVNYRLGRTNKEPL